MSLQLGFFPQFKDADAVLLSGTASDIANLSAQLGVFVASADPSFSIHNLAQVSARNPTRLFVSRLPQSPALEFLWLCPPSELDSIRGKLSALANSGSGHQYFNLAGSSTDLIVSVGEYDESWWQRAA